MRIVKNGCGGNVVKMKGIGKSWGIRIGEMMDVCLGERMKVGGLGKLGIVGIEDEVGGEGD